MNELLNISLLAAKIGSNPDAGQQVIDKHRYNGALLSRRTNNWYLPDQD